MDTHWFSSNRKRVTGLAGKSLRIASALMLLALTFGPLPNAPLGGDTPVAKADELLWKDVRTLMTDDDDTDEATGFNKLPYFGDVLHAIAVAPNGDILVGGLGGDSSTRDGDCSDLGASPTALDYNYDADGTCENNGPPVVYKSTNGGLNWKYSVLPALQVGTTIRKIVVSPRYPSDDFVLVVFSPIGGTLTVSPGVDLASEALATNGVCWSTDGGDTFGACLTGADAAGAPDDDWDNLIWLTAALSPNFDFDGETGTLALGGVYQAAGSEGATTVYTVTAKTLATPTGTELVGSIDLDAPAGAGNIALDVAYSVSEDPTGLARLYTDGGNTCSGVRGDLGFPACPSTGSTLLNNGGAFVATAGSVAFDDLYSSGGSTFFAGAGNEAGEGGVYRFDGSSWESKTDGDSDCDRPVSSLAVAGNGSSTRMVASLMGGDRKRVCRSTNEGSSWSDSEADGGDDVCDRCGMKLTEGDAALTNITAGKARVALNRATPTTTYWSYSGMLGGVVRSTNMGSSWGDTGLTNQNYVINSTEDLNFINAGTVFFEASVTDQLQFTAAEKATFAVFRTDDWGTGAGFRRVLRHEFAAVALAVPEDFETSGVVWVTLEDKNDNVLRSTNGGNTFDDVGALPFENSPDKDENVVQESAISGSTIYVGSQKGHISVTTDGGGSWTLLAKDFGDDIDEFDFASPTVFFITAFDANRYHIWQTRDGGATFTEMGNAPWGNSANGDSITLRLAGYKADTNEGYLVAFTEAGFSEKEIFRMKLPTDTNWENMDLGQQWESVTSTGSSGIGDGRLFWMWARGSDGGCADAPAANAGCLRATHRLLTGDPDDMQLNAGSVDGKNTMMTWPSPPYTTGSGMGSTGTNPLGYTLSVEDFGRITLMSLPKGFLTPPALTSPVANAQVPTNIGDNGIPTVFRWANVGLADSYDFAIGLDPMLADATILQDGSPAAGVQPILNNLLTLERDLFSLVAGNTYYWKVRVNRAEDSCIASGPDAGGFRPACTGVAADVALGSFQGPWSVINTFTVSTTSVQITTPQPNLPLNGSQLPGLTTELSWNNPAGVTQVHIQVVPLNGDGPAINLILGSATTRYQVPAPVFGTGPYVMLPGAGYTWRVRTTGSSDPAITEASTAWGPWSEPRTFTTRRPDSGTLQLVGPINGATISDTTPTLEWKNAAVDEFYYEVQLSADPNFNTNPSTATAAVFHNLLHGGQSTPPNSWTVPDANALKPGSMYWRVRQRLQATPAGSAEVGVAWSPAQRFVIQ